MLFAGIEKFQTFRNRKNTFYVSFGSCCPANGCLLNSANRLGAGQEQDKKQDKPVLSAKTAKTASKARTAEPVKARRSNPADTASEDAAKWREVVSLPCLILSSICVYRRKFRSYTCRFWPV